MLFGGLLARFSVKPAVKHRYPNAQWNVCGGDLGHDCAKMGCENWADVTMRDGWKPGNPVSGIRHQVSVSFVTRNGYITAPSPAQKWTAVSQLPIGPPNVVQRLVKIES